MRGGRESTAIGHASCRVAGEGEVCKAENNTQTGPSPSPGGGRCDDQPQKKEAIGLRDLAWPGSPRFTVIDCGLRKSAEQCRARHRTASPGGSSLSLRECKPQCTQSAGSDMSPVVRRQYYLLALWKNSEHSRIADMSRSLILRFLRGKTSDPDGIHLST